MQLTDLNRTQDGSSPQRCGWRRACRWWRSPCPPAARTGSRAGGTAPPRACPRRPPTSPDLVPWNRHSQSLHMSSNVPLGATDYGLKWWKSAAFFSYILFWHPKNHEKSVSNNLNSPDDPLAHGEDVPRPVEDAELVPAPEDHAHVPVAVPEAGHRLREVAAHVESCVRKCWSLKSSRVLENMICIADLKSF